MDFEWDSSKDEATRRERGIGFERAAEILEGQTIEWPDERREYGEDRIRALGESSSEVLHVVYTRRGDVVRIISVRRANRKERRLWQSRA